MKTYQFITLNETIQNPYYQEETLMMTTCVVIRSLLLNNFNEIHQIDDIF